MDDLRRRMTGIVATLLPFLLRMTPDEGEIVLASCRMGLSQAKARLQRFRRGELLLWSGRQSPL
jgi:hypothetical protein